MKQNTYFIQLGKKNSPCPLDEAISTHLKLSPAQAHSLILNGAVWDWKKKVRLKDPALLLDTSYLIKIFTTPAAQTLPALKPLEIVYEDEFLLAAYKPQGLPNQGTTASDQTHLQKAVEIYLKPLSPYHPEVINRLDTPAAGIVLFARSKPAEKALHELFRLGKIRKYYLAQTALYPEAPDRLSLADTLSVKDKIQEARTRIIHLQNTPEHSWWLILPQTGRFHQIRRHFQKYLLPISGDSRYGQNPTREPLQLYCVGYRFKHPFTQKRCLIHHIPGHLSAIGNLTPGPQHEKK